MAGKWIQKAAASFERKGTKGAFGKATPSKIAAGKAKGGLAAKRAIFAQTMARFAKRKKGRSAERSSKR
jgi:hypothetical protein